MPLNTVINPKDYYSYKDWGQRVFDITNTALDMAHSIKGGNMQGIQRNGNKLMSTIGDTVQNGADMQKQAEADQRKLQGATPAQLGNQVGTVTTGAYGGLQGLLRNRPRKFSYAGNVDNITGAAGATQSSGGASGILSALGGGSGGGMGIGGGTGGGGGAAGAIWSQAGKMYNQTNQAIVKMVGNQWKDDGQRIAYGDSTYAAPSRKDLEKKTNQYVKDLRNQTFYSNANNFEDLAKDINDPNNFVNVSKGATQKQKILGTAQRSLNASGKGAELGGKIGGFAGPMGGAIGTVAGAVVGGIAGIFGGAFGARRARRRLRKIQAAQRYANLSHDQQMQDSISNLTQKNLNTQMAGVLARGGLIETLLHGDKYINQPRYYGF